MQRYTTDVTSIVIVWGNEENTAQSVYQKINLDEVYGPATVWEYYAAVVDVSYENVLDPEYHNYWLHFSKFMFPLGDGTDEFVLNEIYSPSPLESWRLL